ncbi:hypothetical protein [Clostridium sp. C8-1-8]|jgi:hypothetical protein|uniref:hypothetical protein n=1 Tax=Clostridium sp. C8-1-8 TaxID=2698831 RepID=UPI001367EBF3|nr:hypothetical protein [Clostridium sp. C8-1-8]
MNNVIVDIPRDTDVKIYSVEIPKNFKSGYQEFEDGTALLLDENEYFQWAWYYIGHKKGEFAVDFNNVAGFAPVTGNCCEWDVHNRVPSIGNAFFHTYGVMRGINTVRVFGNHSSDEPLHVAVGYVVIKSQI